MKWSHPWNSPCAGDFLRNTPRITIDMNDTTTVPADIFADSKVEVAGKTGTAQVSSGANNAIFVGFAPYDNPKIAVVAIVEHGDEGYYLAPMVKEITNAYFDIYTNDAQKEKTQDIVLNKIEF